MYVTDRNNRQAANLFSYELNHAITGIDGIWLDLIQNMSVPLVPDCDNCFYWYEDKSKTNFTMWDQNEPNYWIDLGVARFVITRKKWRDCSPRDLYRCICQCTEYP